MSQAPFQHFVVDMNAERAEFAEELPKILKQFRPADKGIEGLTLGRDELLAHDRNNARYLRNKPSCLQRLLERLCCGAQRSGIHLRKNAVHVVRGRALFQCISEESLT